MLSPISHHPMGRFDANKGHSTTRVQDNANSFAGTQMHFTKTSFQTRADGLIKPGAVEAWDILTLNEIIKDKVDLQNRKMKEHKER